MKVLCLSDLHLYFILSDSEKYTFYKGICKSLFENKDFDCIVISGDIFEFNYQGNPYKELRKLFDFIDLEIPIICCLGNHEFAYKSIDTTLKFYNNIPKNERYNVYYLDVDNSFKLNEYNFIGNVFWYDNTLVNNPFAKPDKIISNWLDSTIINFIPSIENKKCIEQILNNIKLDKKNILVTHTVPHIDLNTFSKDEPTSLYNQYSGCKDFLNQLKDKNVIAAICGHTHRREIKDIYNIHCINVGNDYLKYENTIKYYILELA